MHTCPVCGYPKLSEAPKAPSGGGSYEICPSCGFQFGVDDDDRGLSYAQGREKWLAKGGGWWSKSTSKPEDWTPDPNFKPGSGQPVTKEKASKKKTETSSKKAVTDKTKVKERENDQKAKRDEVK